MLCDFIGNNHAKRERERERETCLIQNNSPLNNTTNEMMMISKTTMRIEHTQRLEKHTKIEKDENSGNFWNSSLSAPALKSAARV